MSSPPFSSLSASVSYFFVLAELFLISQSTLSSFASRNAGVGSSPARWSDPIPSCRLRSTWTRCSSGRATGTCGTPISWAQSRPISPVRNPNPSLFSWYKRVLLLFSHDFWSHRNVVVYRFADCCLALWWWVFWSFRLFVVFFDCVKIADLTLILLLLLQDLNYVDVMHVTFGELTLIIWNWLWLLEIDFL